MIIWIADDQVGVADVVRQEVEPQETMAAGGDTAVLNAVLIRGLRADVESSGPWERDWRP